jgi:hypothetical protein
MTNSSSSQRHPPTWLPSSLWTAEDWRAAMARHEQMKKLKEARAEGLRQLESFGLGRPPWPTPGIDSDP